MKKYIMLLFIIFSIIVSINITATAAEIIEYPEEIELTTDLQNLSVNSVEEHICSIILEDISPVDVLKVKFYFRKKNNFDYINRHIKVKYRTNQDLNWKDWDKLRKPLKITFDNLDSKQNINLKFKFLVPQSINIRKGNYFGELCFSLNKFE